VTVPAGPPVGVIRLAWTAVGRYAIGADAAALAPPMHRGAAGPGRPGALSVRQSGAGAGVAP
jgi:hypothetical protein